VTDALPGGEDTARIAAMPCWPSRALLPVLAAGELAAPFLVEADGRPIDVAGGNSAPFCHDLDGDGLEDLLVGQFEHGLVRVYRNLGTRGAPRFGAFTFLRAGTGLARVPFG
jgi:hypothetical protein